VPFGHRQLRGDNNGSVISPKNPVLEEVLPDALHLDNEMLAVITTAV